MYVYIFITSYACTLTQHSLTTLMTDQTALGYTVPKNIESAALLILYEICVCIIDLHAVCTGTYIVLYTPVRLRMYM